MVEKEDKACDLKDQIAKLQQDRLRQDEEEEERRRLEQEAMSNRVQKKQSYLPVRGDKVDEKIAEYINNFDLEIPLQRISDGLYMFGSRKIFAKIMNDKLVIRVGGGFMLIDEFLLTYGQ